MVNLGHRNIDNTALELGQENGKWMVTLTGLDRETKAMKTKVLYRSESKEEASRWLFAYAVTNDFSWISGDSRCQLLNIEVVVESDSSRHFEKYGSFEELADEMMRR